MEKQPSQIWIIVIVVGFIAFGSYWAGSNKNITNDPTIEVKKNTEIKATTVSVGTFYDGKEGYSLSIPSGNTSTCIWTYTGGNAAIPGSETTNARTATEKHIIYAYDFYDWKVTCVDDFGNQYSGVFPKK